MNYYMPYFNMYPNMVSNIVPGVSASKGIFSRLLKGFNWGSILNTTQKTLGIVNQALPVIKQVTPVMKNAKTIFKVMNEFKKTETPTNIEDSQDNKTIQNENIVTSEIKSNNSNINFDGSPTFFIN